MTAITPTVYSGMPPTAWVPPAPQLLRNARVFIIGYQADPDRLAAVLPPGLTPHPNNLIQMNMYEVAAEQTSGFGAFSLTYLTVEVEGHDSLAVDGTMAIPGRYFAHYWNSSPRVISYAREGAGIPAQYGTRRGSIENGVLTSVLTVDGADVITARANVTENALGTIGGHLNYYGFRQIPRPEGGRAAASELIELPLPFIADLYEASVEDVAFSFPQGHPAAALAPVTPLTTPR